MATVHHPYFTGITRTVPDANLDLWTAAGWVVDAPEANYVDHAAVQAVKTAAGTELRATFDNGVPVALDLTEGGLAPDGGQALAAKLDAGIGNATLAVLGDSTGNADDEWVRLTVNQLGLDHPAARVLYHPWDSASEAYGTAVQVQAGDVPLSGVQFRDTFTRTGDLYGSTPDLGPVWSGYSSSTGDWSLDGADAVRTEDTTASEVLADSGITGDAEVRISGKLNTEARPATKLFRILHKYADVDNTLCLQVAVYADGSTNWLVWSKVAGTTTTLATGTSAAVAHATSQAALEASIKLVGNTVTATLNTNTLTATIPDSAVAAYGAATKSGVVTTGATITGTLGDRMHSFEVDALSDGIADQTIEVYNGSEPGSRLTYQAERLATMLPTAPDLVILSSCHNYGSTTPEEYITAVLEFVAQVRALHPGTGIAVSSQNPQKSPAANASGHHARLVALRPTVLRRGYGYVPAFEAFRARPDRGEDLIAADGVHPIAAGSALWEDAATSYINSLKL